MIVEYYPKPNQALLLWKLVVRGGSCWKSEVSPTYLTAKSLRTELVEHGLISEENRRRDGKRRCAGRIYLRLEEKGWAWIADHLDAPVARSRAAAEVLQFLLQSLDTHLQRHGFALADVVAPDPEQELDCADSPAATDPHGFLRPDASDCSVQTSPRANIEDADAGRMPEPATGNWIEDEIAAAYATLTNQQSNVRLRLADLRRALPAIPRVAIDEALRNLVRAGAVVLNRLDNPREITPEDEAASMLTVLGDPRHIIHMEIPTHV